MASGTLGVVAVELGRIVGRVVERFMPGELFITLTELGIDFDPELDDWDDIDAAVDALAAAFEAVVDLTEDLADDGDLDDPVESAITVIDAIADLAPAIDTLGAALDTLVTTELPPDFAQRVVDLAIVDQLVVSDALAIVATLFGVIEWHTADTDGGLVERPTLHLDQLPRLVSEPGVVLAERIGWGSQLDFDALAILVRDIARRIRLPAAIVDDHLEVLFLDVEQHQQGLRFTAQLPIATSVSSTLRIGHPSWEGSASVDLDVEPGLTADLLPGTGLAVTSTVGTPSVRGEVTVASTETLTLFGLPDGPRLVATSIELGVELALTGGDISFETWVGLTGVRPLLAGSGDSFSGQFAGAEPPGSDLTLRWSAASGLTFDGTPRLTVTVPGQVDLGPIWLRDWLISLGFDDGAIELATSATVGGTIAVVDFEIEGLGVAAVFDFADPGPGPFALSLAPTWPTRVAMGIDAGAVQGAGFLAVDHDTGRYAGGLAIKIVSVGVNALVIVDTQLEGGSSWALFASLGIDIPGIPLGFGFTLEGLGGLLAIHRRLDADALAVGLRQGAIDAILFPDDPVNDAPILIPQIDQYFPLEPDNFVVGPVIELGWGSPSPLITAQIGVVLSFPEGLIAVLGSITIELPTPEAPLIELHLDTLGVIDLAEGTVLVAASLYDSRLLGTIELSGDMAFFLATSPSPYFALAIGGWHPSFQPPDLLPSVFTQLRRMRAQISLADNVRVTFDNYLAVTSNTIQFGGRFEVVATVKVIATYTARGWFQFDVLLVFHPFQLIADVSAGVSVTKGDKELFGVSLAVHVRGPKPWYADGSAQFKFFGVKVKFNFEVGGRAAPEVPPRVDLLPLIAEQLAADSSWSVIEPSGVRPGLTLASTVEGLLMPDSLVEVSQNVAPLDRTLEVYGESEPVQTRLEVSEASVLDGVDLTPIPGVTPLPVDDWFAPSQYDRMNDRKRLGSASYEPMEAGVSFGLGGDDLPAGVTVEGGHETEIWEPAAPPRRVGVVRHVGTADVHFSVAAERVRAVGPVRAAAPALEVAAVAYHEVAGQRVPEHVAVPR